MNFRLWVTTSSNKGVKWCFPWLLMHLGKLDLFWTWLLVFTQVKTSAKGAGFCKLVCDDTALLSKAA